MTDDQEDSLPRQPGCRLPRRSSAELLDLGRERRPGIQPVLLTTALRMIHRPCRHSAPLLHLAPGCVPLGQGIIVLDLMRKAENCNGISYGYSGLVCFEALKGTTGHESG